VFSPVLFSLQAPGLLFEFYFPVKKLQLSAMEMSSMLSHHIARNIIINIQFAFHQIGKQSESCKTAGNYIAALS
jgi:hypothetical protein